MIRKLIETQSGPGDDLTRPLVRRPVPDDRQREARIEKLSVRGDQREDQGTERNEHEPVRHPDLGPLQHPGVPEGFGKHVPPALAAMITSAGSRLAELDDADDRCHGADKEHDTDDRDGQRHDDRDDFHLRLLLGGDAPFSLVRHSCGLASARSPGSPAARHLGGEFRGGKAWARRAAYPNCQQRRLGFLCPPYAAVTDWSVQVRRPSRAVGRDLWGWRDRVRVSRQDIPGWHGCGGRPQSHRAFPQDHGDRRPVRAAARPRRSAW